MKKRVWVPLSLFTCAVASYWIYAMPPSVPERYILTADNIVSMDTSNTAPEAILVDNGIISAIGPIDVLKRQADVDVIKRDGTLTPGLIEPHTHPIAAAMLGASVDISSLKYTNRAEVMQALKEAVDKVAITPWLVAFGWDPVATPDLTPPTREELDLIAPDRPLLVLTQMLHDAYVNTAAVEAAGITLEGSLLHEVIEMDSVIQKIPPPNKAVVELLVRRQYAKYAKAGFTSIGVVGAVGRHDNPIELLRKISTEENSTLRTFAYLIEKHLHNNTIGGDLDFSVMGAKFWVDGSPFTGGAATQQPYEENSFVNEYLNFPSKGLAPVLNPAPVLIERIEKLHNKGYQIALHAQGERAIDAALDSFDSIQSSNPMPGLRHRLEHNALITEQQIARAAALNVTLGYFVDHIYYYGHVLPKLFGEVRTARYMPVRTGFEAGAVVTLHGDHPATPINAMQTMINATSRTSRVGKLKIGAKQAITPYQALQAMTLNAAIQLGQQDALGSISVGKQADFTLFSGNPLNENLALIEPLATWKSGQPIDHRAVSWIKLNLVWESILSLI